MDYGLGWEMKYSKYLTRTNIAVLSLAVVLLAAGGFSYRMHTFHQQMEEAYGKKFAALRQDLARIERRLVPMTGSSAVTGDPISRKTEDSGKSLVLKQG